MPDRVEQDAPLVRLRLHRGEPPADLDRLLLRLVEVGGVEVEMELLRSGLLPRRGICSSGCHPARLIARPAVSFAPRPRAPAPPPQKDSKGRAAAPSSAEPMSLQRSGDPPELRSSPTRRPSNLTKTAACM